MPRTSGFFVLPLAGVLLLSACGGEEPVEPSAASTSTTAAAVPSEFPEAPIATIPSGVAGLDLEVYALVQDGESVLLQFAATNVSTESAGIFNALGSFAGSRTVDGVTLFDSGNLKRYLVLTDSSGGCLCSQNPVDSIDPGERRFFSALFPAPPSDVLSLTVETSAGSLPAIPITRS